MSQSLVGGALLGLMGMLIFIIFACLYYLWSKTRQLERLAKRTQLQAAQPTATGSILGYSGNDLYEVLKDQSDTPERVQEIRKRYLFYLSRHLEAVVEQGIIDAKRSQNSTISSEMAVGGPRGEVMSWLPQEVLGKFYLFGRGLNFDKPSEQEKVELVRQLSLLVMEVLSKINMESHADRITDLITKKYLENS
jgi:hypothetical protein